MSNRQEISEAIPRSTLVVGSAFWLVLVGLITWLLLATVGNGRQLEKLLADGDHDRQTIADVRSDVNDHEVRLRTLERDRRQP